jgi:hypothetical protein
VLVETNEGTHLRVVPERKRIEGFSNGAVASFQFLGAYMMLSVGLWYGLFNMVFG